MTIDINEWYGVTIKHGEKIGPRRFQAHATIFRRDNFESIEEFFVEGRAMTSADSNALAEARRKVTDLGEPSSWNSK